MLLFRVFGKLQPRPGPPTALSPCPLLHPGHSTPFISNSFRTLSRNGRTSTSFLSIACRLFPSQWGCTPPLGIFIDCLVSNLPDFPSSIAFLFNRLQMLFPQPPCFDNDPFSWGVYTLAHNAVPAGETLPFTSLPAVASTRRGVRTPSPIGAGQESQFFPLAPLHQKGHGVRMALNGVLTPRRETSPLVPVSKSSRADAGCGNFTLPIPGQVSCHQAARPG
jgi:hypothetical protein